MKCCCVFESKGFEDWQGEPHCDIYYTPSTATFLLHKIPIINTTSQCSSRTAENKLLTQEVHCHTGTAPVDTRYLGYSWRYAVGMQRYPYSGLLDAITE